MCGISGVIGLNTELSFSEHDIVRNMTQVIAHRGPSQQGTQAFNRVILGNARLAIIDPSERSNLPMSNADGSVWICYNGEVSNFKELKQKYKLEEKYQFKGYSDTEVILHLYEELGLEFTRELSGMFAFCLVDFGIDKAYLIRDFFGINPMFWTEINGKIWFCSELKGFFEIPEFNPERLNREAMFHYFTLAYLPGDRTPYEQIHEMREGQMMSIDLNTGKYELDYHYQVQYEQNHDISEKQATKDVHDLLLDSVRRNLISDAPLGMTLSGGIDTSTMLGLVKELGLSHKMNTFSLKMGESSFDESRYQHIMAEFAGTIHHEIVVNPDDVIEVIMEHVAHIDEPIGDGSAIPSYLLAREASKEVDVLLSGEGGDEVFNAYATNGAYQYRKLYRKLVPKLGRDMISWLIHNLPSDYSKLSFDFMAKRFSEGCELDTPEAHMYWRHVLTDDEKKLLMPNDHDFRRSGLLFSDLFYDNDFDDDLNRISRIDVKHFFIDDLMVKNDRMFMAHSIETRFPMMDRILVDYVTKLPCKYRIKGFKRRYIQKKAMEGLIPNEILRRSSFGLEMPHSIWFFEKLGGFADKYFTRENVNATGILNWEYVETLWKTHLAGKKDYGRALWCILLYLIWHDLFVRTRNYKQYLRSPVPAV